jgi:PAS domain S-box-containing protein
MKDMHNLLARQLKKHGIAPHLRPQDAQEFLRAVDAAYRQADEDRALLERSLELTSQEMLRDLDELRRAKEALSQSQGFLEKAQELASLGGWASTLDDRAPQTWSKECFRIFGLEAGSPPSFESYLNLVHPDDRESLLRARAAAIGGGAPYSVEYRIKRADGATRWVRSRADVIRDTAGAALKLIGVIQDITDQRELEDRLRQSQKMEAVGRLAGGIAHDFNNVLTAIKGYSSFLKGAVEKDGGLYRDAEQIEKAADRAAALTHQLLAFSRKQVLKPVVLDVNQAVVGLEGMMRCLIREDIELVTRLKPGLGRINADPDQVAQVLTNLIVNGRDAMPNGGRLVVETDDVEAGAGPLGVASVMISVADGGVGMGAEVLAHVFEPFFTTKAQGKGTGLGLSTVYGIVSQSGGHIAVESVPGQGTKFIIHFPRLEGGAEPKAAVALPGAGRLQGSETVLVVEDDDIVRALIRRTLREQGYKVLAAIGGDDALRLFQAHSGAIDVVLTDIIMPGMNGRALAERLVSVKPELRVLYMSGYTDDVIARHGVLEPGTPFLQKPFAPRMLAEKLREILAGSCGDLADRGS